MAFVRCHHELNVRALNERGEVMAKAALGPEALPVKYLIRALVHQIINPSPKPFHAALDWMLHQVEDHCNDQQTHPRGYKTLKDSYTRTRRVLNAALVDAGEEPLPLKPLFATTLEHHPDPQEVGLPDTVPQDAVKDLPPIDVSQANAELAAMLEGVSIQRPFTTKVPIITEDGEVIEDGALDDGDLSILDGLSITDAKAETSHASKLIQHALHKLLPAFAAKNSGRAGIGKFVSEGQLYFIVLTENGRFPTGERFTISFTVDPYKTFMRAGPDILLRNGTGKHAHAKLTDPDNPEHKYWAQFILHKPGRKLRFFGSRQTPDGTEWLDVPSATNYIVMTDAPPWFRPITLAEFRQLPKID